MDGRSTQKGLEKVKPSQINILDRQICGTVWTSSQVTELMELLSCEIGPRPPGSKAMRQAQGVLAEVLRKLGSDNVHEHIEAMHVNSP